MNSACGADVVRGSASAGAQMAGTLGTRRGATLCGLGLLALSGQHAPAGAQQPSLTEIGTQGWLFPVWDRVYRVDLSPLRSNIQTLLDAAGVLRDAQIQTVICLIPSRKRLMRRFLPAGAQVSPDAAQRYSLPLSELGRGGVLTPDLNSVFQQHGGREPAAGLFFRTDTHWTPLGAEIAAVEIARQMREKLALPASPRPGTQLGGWREMSLAIGDLVPHLPPAQRAAHGPERAMIRHTLPPEGSLALLEEDQPDTVIVGTSNVQPRFGFQPVLSNQLQRPVGLAWRPNNVGPYGVLLEYLGSDAFRRHRPRVLVWNHMEQDMLNSVGNPAWGGAAMPAAEFLNRVRRAVA